MSKIRHPKLGLHDWWRFPRLFWYLAVRPDYIPRYLRNGLPTKFTPLELGLPWWSFGAIDAVSRYLRPEMEVFEFGSGGSTIFLANRVKKVTSVEDSSEWTALVRAEADKLGKNNIEVLTRPYDFHKAVNFLDSSYLAALGGHEYDLIVVDGQEVAVQVRPDCFWKAEQRVKSGGLIVLDDSWRYPQVKSRNRAKHWADYKGVGCCRRGVTSTCLFYY